MKEPNKKSSTNCDNIEQLLVKKNIDELTQDENLAVEKHLKFCERCQSYQNTLLNLQNAMQIGAEEKLVADPAIRRNIIRQMKAVKPEETGVLKTGWQHIRAIFEYRIPVYQTLLGVTLVLLISLGINQLLFTVSPETSTLQSFAQIETVPPGQLSVIENLEIVDRQKIGRNVKEDPALTRFLVTAR